MLISAVKTHLWSKHGTSYTDLWAPPDAHIGHSPSIRFQSSSRTLEAESGWLCQLSSCWHFFIHRQGDSNQVFRASQHRDLPNFKIQIRSNPLQSKWNWIISNSQYRVFYLGRNIKVSKSMDFSRAHKCSMEDRRSMDSMWGAKDKRWSRREWKITGNFISRQKTRFQIALGRNCKSNRIEIAS